MRTWFLVAVLLPATIVVAPAASAFRPLGAGDDVVFRAAHYAPRPGRLFVGAFLRFTHPHAMRVFSLTCTAHLGGRIVHPDTGTVAFAGGVKLRAVIRRTYTAPAADGTRFLQSVACGWRIPSDAKRKLLSLLPRPSQVPCDTSCPPIGLDIRYGEPSDTSPTSFRSYNQTTWRVAAR